MDKNILSISEAASLLGVSDETLRNWERDGKLTPFHTEGGHRRYYKIDIEKLAGTYIEPTKSSIGNRVECLRLAVFSFMLGIFSALIGRFK